MTASLAAHLDPLPLAGEAVRFDLAEFRSTLTREMLQARVRTTARAFGVGDGLVAANLVDGGAALEVEAAALVAANDTVRARLEAGPEEAVVQLRGMAAARRSIDRRARAVAAAVATGGPPTRRSFVAYVDASASFQALGSLRFCLPSALRPRLAEAVGDPTLVDALVAPDGPTLWSSVRARELALARARLCSPAGDYARRLAEHQRAYGYLGGEDVDFQTAESLDAVDARLAALAAGGAAALAAEQRRLAGARASDRAARAGARGAFASGARPPALVSSVLLARALAAHEDDNRRAKMRFLRDLRDLAGVVGLDLERDGLATFAAACPGGSGR